MSINKVNTTSDETNFKFLKNQSSIIRTVSTNNVSMHGVNTVVSKPKVGDIMCVTRYKNGDTLLEADKQKVVWIDGLSIEPLQLSVELEPVGICVVVNKNNAIVKYKKEFDNIRWSVGERWELPNLDIMKDGAEHTLEITFGGKTEQFTFISNSRAEFTSKLNDFCLSHHNNGMYSAELVELDTDKPANDTSDTKDGDSYRNRIIVNAFFSPQFNNIAIKNGTENLEIKRAIGKHIKDINFYYLNNGFTRNWQCGCCRAKYYDYTQNEQNGPTSEMTNINIVPGGKWDGLYPVSLDNFTSNSNCQFLRDTFVNYDKYFDSMMIKYPCGEGGTIAEFPSGKENTYKLAYCTFYNSRTKEYEILYLAANKAASIDVRGPKLTAGNWWLPSTAEFVQIMRNINFWEGKNIDNNTDIINRVINKLRNADTNWNYLYANKHRWTSSRYDQLRAYNYDGNHGGLYCGDFHYGNIVTPITIYKF